MQVDRCRRSGSYQLCSDQHYVVEIEKGVGDSSMSNNFHSISSSSLNSLSSSSSTSSSNSVSPCGVNSIEHYVSKMDTLAGVAIKYGVEVADIKRMNGLVTDLQMFALKTLQIPLPGRHPPSPGLSNGSANQGESIVDQTPPRRLHSDVLDSLQSLKSLSPARSISPAMSTLQGYYGLKPPNHKHTEEGTEMSVYGSGNALYLEDEQFPSKPSPLSDSPPSRHRQTRSLVNCFMPENGEFTTELPPVSESGDGEADKSSSEKIFRRRQKTDDSGSRTPVTIIKNQDNNGSSGLSSRTTKGLALRPKSSSRIALTADSDSGWFNPIPIGLGDSILANGFDNFRKSSSASNLQEQENYSAYLIRSNSKWSLKPEVIGRPIFDGVPKPSTARRNKAALD